MTRSLRDEIAKELFLDAMGRSSRLDDSQITHLMETSINVADGFCSKLIAKAQTKGCPKCFGSGGKVAAPCKNCKGTGKVDKL